MRSKPRWHIFLTIRWNIRIPTASKVRTPSAIMLRTQPKTAKSKLKPCSKFSPMKPKTTALKKNTLKTALLQKIRTVPLLLTMIKSPPITKSSMTSWLSHTSALTRDTVKPPLILKSLIRFITQCLTPKRSASFPMLRFQQENRRKNTFHRLKTVWWFLIQKAHTMFPDRFRTFFRLFRNSAANMNRALTSIFPFPAVLFSTINAKALKANMRAFLQPLQSTQFSAPFLPPSGLFLLFFCSSFPEGANTEGRQNMHSPISFRTFSTFRFTFWLPVQCSISLRIRYTSFLIRTWTLRGWRLSLTISGWERRFAARFLFCLPSPPYAA